MPLFSTSGIKLAYLDMKKPKSEGDKNRLMVFDMNSFRLLDVTKNIDLSVETFIWLDEDTIIFIAEEKARVNVFKVSVSSMNLIRLTSSGSAKDLSRISDTQFVFMQSHMDKPDELFLFDISNSKGPQQLTFMHSILVSRIKLSKPEEYYFVGSLNELVQGWLLKPVDFNPTKKYPLAFLIHGGPQLVWKDTFGSRWNPQIFSNAGYVVVMINFHGSTSFGTNFTDSITGNWGTYPYEDLMAGLDYVLEAYPYIDSTKMAAIGGSYGGFMVNFINGHTDRFSALVNHDGVFDTFLDYYTNDYLCAYEYDFKGTPYENPTLYKKYSPSEYVGNWKTPTLVIHGGKDYRVSDNQAFATFTALQRRGIESKLLYFPDEGHWISKPANYLKWINTILQWIDHFNKQ
jgi:dipeptidyl aminopeptidase/acylaminoacyl peptidase